MIPWRCRNGHALGYVIRYGRYNCLLLIDPREPQPEPFATISGGADVRCLVCGAVRTWRVGEDFRRLFFGLEQN